MTIGLRGLASYLPEQVIPREAFSYLAPLVPSMEIFPRERRRLDRPDAIEFMCVEASKRALEDARLEAQDIDLIVCQGLGGRFVAPGPASFVKRELGLRIETPAWNIAQVCAGFIDGVRIAWLAVKAEPEAYKNVLVVTATAWWTGEWGADATCPSAATCGDGAAAGVVSVDDVKLAFLSYANRTHDEVYEWLNTRGGAPANPDLLRFVNEPLNNSFMHVNDQFPQWMAETGRHLAAWLLPEAARKAGVALTDITRIATHQAQDLTIKMWRETLEAETGLPQSLWYDTWHAYGNMGGADSAVNLEHLLHREGVETGKVIAYFSPGAAGHSPAMLMRAL
jgi:3-oxoacyl-[acyl-carrier-protein] synthase-3